MVCTFHQIFGETFSTCRDRRYIYRVLVGTPNGKNILVKPRRKWEENITIDLQEVGCEATNRSSGHRISVDKKEKVKPSTIR